MHQPTIGPLAHNVGKEQVVTNPVLKVWIALFCFPVLAIAAYFTVQYLDIDSFFGRLVLVALTLFAMFGGIQRLSLLIGELFDNGKGDGDKRRR
jgi:hypothetical protein